MGVVQRTVRGLMGFMFVGALIGLGAWLGSLGAADEATVARAEGRDASGVDVMSTPERAALAWVEFQGQSLYMETDDAEARIRELVSQKADDYRKEQIEALEFQYDKFGVATTEVWHVFEPLGTNVVESQGDRAVVEVWALVFISAGGVQEPIGAWTTFTVDVEKVDAEWKVWSARADAGPMPGLSPQNVPTPNAEDMAVALEDVLPVSAP